MTSSLPGELEKRQGKRVAVVGAQGILGDTFCRVLERDIPVRLGRSDFPDIDERYVVKKIKGIAPEIIINCAADTNVEAAQVDDSAAIAINVKFAKALAIAASELNVPLIHFSSTGCYGDWKAEPFIESDPLRPTTRHHVTKAEGEDIVLSTHKDTLIFRLGWIFGGHPGQRKNFVCQRILESKGRKVMPANLEQFGNPTFAYDVVSQVLKVIPLWPTRPDIFNCVGGGERTSRLGYVKAIMQAAGIPINIIPGKFERLAPVSFNESAINFRLEEAQLAVMPAWTNSLACFVKKQMEQLDFQAKNPR